MAEKFNQLIINQKINDYINLVNKIGLKIWRLYIFGSYAKGTYNENSDIDLAIFLDMDELDGFDEDVCLMKLRRKVDLRIEPHAFSKTDFDDSNPYINEIIKTGHRII